MPVSTTRAILKGYFNAGDEPTEDNFAQLIDSTASTNEANYLTGSLQNTGSVALGSTLTVVGATTVTGSLKSSGGINTQPEILTPAANVTITAAQAGKLLLIPSVATGGGKDNYKLPIPTFIGQTYMFAWSGIAADADNIQFQATTADAITFTGGLLDFDTDATDASGYVIVYPGAANDLLLLTNPQNFDITFTATTLTNYHVRGYAMSTDTVSAFNDL